MKITQNQLQELKICIANDAYSKVFLK